MAGLLGRGLPLLPRAPSEALQRLHMERVFSISSGPPSAWGMMWSTSTLLGRPE